MSELNPVCSALTDYHIAGFYCESFNFANFAHSELLAKIKIRTKNLYAMLLGYFHRHS